MRLNKGDKLVFIGDSITDCGRNRPVGEAPGGGLGYGYVVLVDAFLQSAYPELNIRTVNVGISGHTVRDLKARWSTDVFDQKPDWLSIMIGTNDVWRQFDSPAQRESHVLIDEYETTLRELVTRTKPLLKGLVLMTPFFLESCQEDAMRSRMDEYGAVVRQIAEESDCLFVDTQAAFNKVLEHCYSAKIALDRVHPNQIGHMTLAREFLKAIGFNR